MTGRFVRILQIPTAAAFDRIRACVASRRDIDLDRFGFVVSHRHISHDVFDRDIRDATTRTDAAKFDTHKAGVGSVRICVCWLAYVLLFQYELFLL